MNRTSQIRSFVKNTTQGTPKPKINLVGHCPICKSEVPMNSGLFYYLPEYVQYADWQKDRVGLKVCISCLPPQIQKQLSEKTVNASKNDFIDNLFSEIFKAD